MPKQPANVKNLFATVRRVEHTDLIGSVYFTKIIVFWPRDPEPLPKFGKIIFYHLDFKKRPIYVKGVLSNLGGDYV